MDNFLVPVDFSEASASALKFAFEFNRHFLRNCISCTFLRAIFRTAESDAGFLQYESLKKAHEENTWNFISLNKGDYHYDTEVVTSGVIFKHRQLRGKRNQPHHIGK
jgi:hypothetical protein